MLGIVSTSSLSAVELDIVKKGWANIKDSADYRNRNRNRKFYSSVTSADGRFVAFTSYADDLVATDTNGALDVFVRDLQSGITTLVSVNKDGTDSGNRESFCSAISADGRFVAFSSEANDLVAADTNGALDVFVRDLQDGTTTLVSVNKADTDSGYGDSFANSISADGRFVAFGSDAYDLVATDTNDKTDVFVRDLLSGTTTLVSVNMDGTDSAHGYSFGPAISADGRFIAFLSDADDLVVTDTKDYIFVRDLQSGTTTTNNETAGPGLNGSYLPVVSAAGTFVIFQSIADDLVATDTNITTVATMTQAQ